jgi:hypothetical protein
MQHGCRWSGSERTDSAMLSDRLSFSTARRLIALLRVLEGRPSRYGVAGDDRVLLRDALPVLPADQYRAGTCSAQAASVGLAGWQLHLA